MKRVQIPADVVARVRVSARDRCGYCLSPQSLVMAPLHIEHIVPIAKGGSSNEENLWLSCPLCNGHKGAKYIETDTVTNSQVALFNPRMQVWHEHFRWVDGGLRIKGLTACGRVTVRALHLDSDADAIQVRGAWISVGWYPPKD